MPSRIFAARALSVAATGVCAVSLSTGQALAAGTHHVRGVVVHRNSRASSFVVAAPNGVLYAIHSLRAPALGTRVSVTVAQLRNGTFVARRTADIGHVVQRHAVRERGVVSFVDHQTGTYTLSARGVSMLVHTGRAAHMTTTSLPAVGAVVTTTGTINGQGEMDAQSTQVVGQDTSGINVEGTILSVDPTASTITVSADDNNLSGASITISVPSSLTMSGFGPGQEVELVVQDVSGSYTLLGSASDQGVQGAQNQGDQQGNQGEDSGNSSSSPSQDGSSSQVGSSSQDGSSPQVGSSSENGSSSQVGSSGPAGQSGPSSGTSTDSVGSGSGSASSAGGEG